MHETEAEQFGCRKEAEAGAGRGLPFHPRVGEVGVQCGGQLPLVLDRNDPPQRQFGDGAKVSSLPAVQQFLAANQAQDAAFVVEEAFLP